MEYNFCPKCGNEAERKLYNLLVCKNCGYNFYINPSSTNAVILENSKGEILLIKRKFEPKKGYLDLPGGFIETGESLEESSIREVKEELGIDITEVKYFNSYPDEYLFQGINIKTLGFVLTGKVEDNVKIVASDDADEATFYKKEDLPIEKVAFKSLRQGLRDYLKQKLPIPSSA
jgi:NADH pyrophosphatase NudC (nudix superfamily)